ncbi:hypothetical protein [uncultured Methylovirgula sp.]|uniref:hypothetical protein n=1 Tax=uncultured Methylovirgula sp. TaxID=1285960 RepID=UPI00263068A0|nr:hypothetical protein [uncultured Methylovirgula sp.]
MINAEPTAENPPTPENSRVEEILSSGPSGALVVAGIATVVVAALWLAFYFFVFVPRGAVQ